MPSPIVTRFAPSPTGYLHIGGARTALFNWLYARGRGGKFLLRIEDTDRARHNEAAIGAIIDGLSWLGLDWDGEPVSQYARQQRHAEAARALLAKGAAYRCYMTPEEIEQAREAARAEKSRFESPWRDASSEAAPERPHTIRFRAPREGATIIRDAVQGEVSFPNSALDDLIVLRSDGAPTYNLAVVVDDHDMGVTHVIRGDDHLNNAARQQQIYESLGWDAPVFAHVPLIHGPDGAKLSKRHGALGVESYRELGYLPDGLVNYLMRLGWSHGDDEIISRERALQWFDIAGVNKAPARLDLAKLAHINAHYLKGLEDDAFVRLVTPFLEALGIDVEGEPLARLKRACPALKERAATLVEAAESARFLWLERPVVPAGKAAKPLDKPGAGDILQGAGSKLAAADWSAPAGLDIALRSAAAEIGCDFAHIGPPLRAALIAGLPAPSLGVVLYALGRDEALARISDQARGLASAR